MHGVKHYLQVRSQVFHFALIAIDRRVDLQPLAINEKLATRFQFGKRYPLLAADTTTRVEVVKKVEAVRRLRFRKSLLVAVGYFQRGFDKELC